MAGFLIPPWYKEETVQPVSVYLMTWLWGFEIACAMFTFAKAFRQTYMMRVRSRRWNMYIALVWAEWTACIIISIVSWLYLHGTIPPDFWIYFAILVLWTVQVQCILQIIINRVALLMYDQRQAKRMRWTVFFVIALINISVFIVWIPARLQISDTWIHANSIWDRIEKGIFLLVDASLNCYFIYCVRTKLIANGLEKYKFLFWFNCSMIFVSISLDVLIIGIMSMHNDLLYMQFHPLTYLIKLHIELNMADLIAKVVRASNPLPSMFQSTQQGLGTAPPETPPNSDGANFWGLNMNLQHPHPHPHHRHSHSHSHRKPSDLRSSGSSKLKGLTGLLEMFSGTEASGPPTGHPGPGVLHRRPENFQLQLPEQSVGIGRISGHTLEDAEAGQASTSTSQGSSADARKMELLQRRQRRSEESLESMRDYASIAEE